MTSGPSHPPAGAPRGDAQAPRPEAEPTRGSGDTRAPLPPPPAAPPTTPWPPGPTEASGAPEAPGAPLPPPAHESAKAAAARGVKGAARVSGRVGSWSVAQARRAANAQGADQSGLNRLIYLGAANSAGDAAVAISLASTVFFAGATSGQRGQVALFLALTMVPFAIVAPLIGPFLDRFSHGRRWAMGGTMAARAFLCLILASAVETNGFSLYWAALGVLVGSKAFDVTRAAAVPRLLPPDLTLVKANGRVSLAGVVAVAVTAPIAGITIAIGPRFCLYYAALVFVVATIVAIQMPAKVDSSAGEETLALRRQNRAGTRKGTQIPARVAFALRANCGPRFLSGFLTMFLTFLLQAHQPSQWHHSTGMLVGLVIGSVGAGTTIGIFVSSILRRVSPSFIVVFCLLADVVAVLLCTVMYRPATLVVLGVTAGLMQQLAKVALDSTIQSGVPERVQSSAFARSNATLQMVWVIGGFVGIALPLIAHLGLAVAAAILGAWTVFVLIGRPRRPGQPLIPSAAAPV